MMGNETECTNSDGCSEFLLTPTMKSANSISRLPSGPITWMVASNAASTGSESPAGEQVPRFPPRVPAARICGEPTVLAA